jgi:CubicO group peptidase (beta-lactamase class C family)
MKKVINTIILGVITHLSFSQSIDTGKLNTYFDILEKNNKFMGTVSINKNGKQIYTKSVGFVNVETKQKANGSSKYRIGSLTKTFTAALIFKAVEEKKLTLSKNIQRFFPQLKNVNKITIAQLLSHRSGIGNFTSDDTFPKWRTQYKTKAEMMEIIAKAGNDFTPDSTTSYSNSNYVLLTYILEDVYKKPFSKILEEKIIKKAGLKNTYFGSKINANNNEAFSYKFREEWLRDDETDMSIPLGAGAIVSTTTDINLFIEALFTGKIISLKSVEQMKPKNGNIGMGLLLPPYNNKSGYGHNGSIDAFSSFFIYLPKEKITYSITSNGSSINLNTLNETIVKAINNEMFEIPEFKKFAVTSEMLDKYIGIYFNDKAPFKLTITKTGNTLQVQPTGQPVFDLIPTEENVFVYEKRNVVIRFNPENKTLNFKMSERIMDFTKE